MVTCSHYRKANTRRIKPPPARQPAQSDDAIVLQEGGRGETNTEITPSLPLPLYWCRRCPRYRRISTECWRPPCDGISNQSRGLALLVGSILLSERERGSSTLRNRCVPLYFIYLTQRKLDTSLTVLYSAI